MNLSHFGSFTHYQNDFSNLSIDQFEYVMIPLNMIALSLLMRIIWVHGFSDADHVCGCENDHHKKKNNPNLSKRMLSSISKIKKYDLLKKVYQEGSIDKLENFVQEIKMINSFGNYVRNRFHRNRKLKQYRKNHHNQKPSLALVMTMMYFDQKSS